MKKLSYLLIIILIAAPGFTQHYSGSSFRTLSFYGFSGLTFIPTAQIMPENQYSIGYISKPNTGDNLTLNPFSTHLGLGTKSGNLEISLTNTPFYASNNRYGGVSIHHGTPGSETWIPIYPSVKYRIMPMVEDNYYTSMACGIALPYGAYYVVDKHFSLKFYDITLHSGVGTKLTTYHAFAGMTFTFGKRTGEIHRDFPLEMMFEGDWGGSLKNLVEKEEAFLALSFRYAWTSSLQIMTFFRIDYQPSIEDNIIVSNSPTKRMGIGLDLALDKQNR